MKEALADLDVLEAGKEFAEHVAKRIFVIRQRPLPVGFQDDQPDQARARQNAPPRPRLPEFPAIRTPLAREAHPIGAQLEPTLPLGLRLVVAKDEPAVVE